MRESTRIGPWSNGGQWMRSDNFKAVEIAMILPALDWLRRYQRVWLRADLIAGVTLAA